MGASWTTMPALERIWSRCKDLLADLVFKTMSTRAGSLIPVTILGILVYVVATKPALLTNPRVIDFELPSEQAIPELKPRPNKDPNDIVGRFRYGATGTEFRGGIPYWIFR